MKGPLPEELGGLYKLKKLVVSRNQFCGQIPTLIGNLENLPILDLSFIKLNGTLPSEIGGLKSLMKMDLSDNFIRGKIPLELGDLKNVTLLDLRNNGLHGNLPQTLTDMSNLQELYVGTNPIGGNISLAWDKLPKLMSFDLSTSRYEGRIPESLGSSKHCDILVSMAIVSPGKSHRIWRRFIPSLNTLYLNGNNLSGTVVFPEIFCRRLGKRLALWNNSPGLCYEGSGIIILHGVSSCSSESSKAASHPSSPTSFVSPGIKRYDVEYVSVLLLLLYVGTLMAQQP